MDKEFDIIYWNDLKSKLKQNYPALTNSDLMWRHGTEEDLLSAIAFKLRKTKNQMLEIIEKL